MYPKIIQCDLICDSRYPNVIWFKVFLKYDTYIKVLGFDVAQVLKVLLGSQLLVSRYIILSYVFFEYAEYTCFFF